MWNYFSTSKRCKNIHLRSEKRVSVNFHECLLCKSFTLTWVFSFPTTDRKYARWTLTISIWRNRTFNKRISFLSFFCINDITKMCQSFIKTRHFSNELRWNENGNRISINHIFWRRNFYQIAEIYEKKRFEWVFFLHRSWLLIRGYFWLKERIIPSSYLEPPLIYS